LRRPVYFEVVEGSKFHEEPIVAEDEVDPLDSYPAVGVEFNDM